jgi:hypothetical protein
VAIQSIRLTWQNSRGNEAAFVVFHQDPGGASVEIATLPVNIPGFGIRGCARDAVPIRGSDVESAGGRMAPLR